MEDDLDELVGDIEASSSVRDVSGPVETALHWLVLDGNRLVVAATLVAAVFAVFYGLVTVGAVSVGPESSAATVFGSGLTSGTVTLVTIALSINQLVLSRVFGSTNELLDRLDGTRDLRERVADRAALPVTPNDPAEFLSLVARTLRARASDLREEIEGEEWAGDDVRAYLDDVIAYGENIDDHVESGTNIVDALAVILGTEYAQNMTATRHLKRRYGDRLSDEAADAADAVLDLLEAVAITRQFFKTLAVQQDFARLSRVVAYSGLAAFVAAVSLTLVYMTDGVTLPPAVLPPVVSVGIAVVATPLSAFIAYVLRAATIARHTVSVGPFVPPESRSE